MKTKNQLEFTQFMNQRRDAALAYINGDAKPLGELTAHHSPATFYRPSGHCYQNADTVWSQYEADAKNFESGSEGELEILHMAASDDLAYWVGIQRALVRVHGKPEPVAFNLRVTELFRREGDAWKLIHRHADPLVA